MYKLPFPPILQHLPEELDENAVQIAQLLTILKWTLHLYTGYYAQLLQEVALSNSDIPETVERMQSELSEMETLTRNLLNPLKTFLPRSPDWQKTLNSDEFQNHCYNEAGKFFL